LFLQRFIPRLLPGAENPEGAESEPQQQMFFMPTYALVFIAVVIPVLVVTIALVVYLQFGQSVQYDEYYSQARAALAQAVSETDPIRQREAWQSVLNLVNKAEEYRSTTDSAELRSQAQAVRRSLRPNSPRKYDFTAGSGTGRADTLDHLLDAVESRIADLVAFGKWLHFENAHWAIP
jgi:predicted membrane chloride channel (bestrophin family)